MQHRRKTPTWFGHRRHIAPSYLFAMLFWLNIAVVAAGVFALAWPR